MNHRQGFSANLATGLLVTTASLFALPVFTTRVSVGALFGIGLTSRQADFRVVRNILLFWLSHCGAEQSLAHQFVGSRSMSDRWDR
jgi:PiT family inorganic phosphate transporter